VTAEDDPITATMVAVTAASGALSAGGAIAGGMQAKSAATQQGRVDTEEAAVAKMQAGAEISNETENAAKTISKVEAGAGAAGVTAESARPVLSEDYTQAKMRAMYTRFNGDLAASQDIYAARIAKYEGQQAMWKGIFGAGQAVLGAASNIGKIGMSKGWGSSSSTSTSGNFSPDESAAM
jgi:hypothetical protein